ncbi:hypothetical protein IJI99_02855, partial [bacterium]|nr:hypothetical protein [bacterium]
MASIETRSIPEEAITSLSSRSESSSEPVSTPETEIFSPATLAEQFWYDHRQDILNQLAEGDEPDFYALADLFDSQDYPQLTDDQLEQLEETISFYARNLDYNNSISDLFDRTSDGSVSPVNFTDQQKFAFLIHNFNEFNFCYDDTEEVKPLLEGEDAQLVLTLMLTEFGYLTANPTDDYQRFCQTGHADIAKQVIIDDHLTTVLSTFEHQDNSNPVIACGRHAHFSPTQTPNIAQKLVNIQQAVYLSARNYLAERASKLLPTSQREDYEAILSWLELDEEESNSYDESLFTYSSQDDWLVYIKKYLAYDYVTTANEPFKARQDWPNYLDQYGKLADAHLSSHAHQDSSSSEKLTRFNQTQQLIVFLCRQINVDESTTSFAGEQFAFDNPSALLEQLVAHPEILHENLNSQVLRLFVLQPTRSNWQINFNDLYSAWQQGINTDALLISPDPVAKLKELAN